MPLIDDYRDMLESDVADLSNVDKKLSGSAGSVAAALFLREFTGKRPWAHLDIAGPARSASEDGEITKGGTGFGVRLLLRYLAG
jgi:leucyl aminopeptidase